MKNLLIKLNELKIENYSRIDDSFLLNIIIDVNGEKDFLKRQYKINKSEILVNDLINFIKEHVKSNNKQIFSNNFIETIVVVRFAEDLEGLESKIANFFKRFSELIKNFKNRGYSENYLMNYKNVDGFSQRF